jgi:hypothetical protein
MWWNRKKKMSDIVETMSDIQEPKIEELKPE